MSDDKVWVGLNQAVIKAIYENTQRRVSVSWVAQGHEGEAPQVPLGLVELAAEETIKLLPAIVLWSWEEKNIITPDDVRKTKRGKR